MPWAPPVTMIFRSFELHVLSFIQLMSAGYSFSAALLPTTAPTCPPGTGKTRV